MTDDHLEPGTRLGRFSIRDLLVLMAVVAALLAWFLPSLLKAREDARRMSCSGRMKQLALALHNYHSVYKCLPSAMGGTTWPGGNAGRLSGLVAVLPFAEAHDLYEKIANPLGGEPAFGPPPWDPNFAPWQEQYFPLQCPSDTIKNESFARTNYVFSVGDLTTNLHTAKRSDARGMFLPGQAFRFRDVLDGLSNTIMLAEVGKKRSNLMAGQFVVDVPASQLKVPQDCYQFVDPQSAQRYLSSAKLSDLGRGGNYADGAGGYSLAHMILPPNGPSCAINGTAEVDGIFSASSRHPGGCHIAIGDGAVIFITNSVDTGDQLAPTPTTNYRPNGRTPIRSPYGIWGELGTKAGAESIEERLNK